MERYQDYVIKDGKFVGKFEEMYRKFDDPWHQQEVISNSYSRLNTVLTLQRLKIERVLEVGCGLGFFTEYLSKTLQNVSVTGMDISQTAVEKAKESYPDLDFFTGDLKDIDAILCRQKLKYDAIIFSELMWFILPDLRGIVEKLKSNFKGYLIINQTFYKSGQQYGTEYFTNLDEMLDYLNLKLVGYSMIDMQNEWNSYETHSIFQF